MGLAVILVLVGVIEMITERTASPQAVSNFQSAFGLGLIGLLCLPSAWTSAKNLMGEKRGVLKDSAGQQPRFLVGVEELDVFKIISVLALILFPATLALGHMVTQNEDLTWLILPPLNVIATGLPVLWLALLGLRKLQGGNPQQQWGVLAIGFVLAPVLIITLELVLLAMVGGIGLAYLSTQPEQLNQLLELIQQIRNLGSMDQESLLRMLEPYLTNQWVMIGLMLIAALFVPMIEEILKPLGVWLLAWKKLTPAEGLAGGILSGAAFALFENLGNTSAAGEQWALVVSSRIPAALLHMVTSGLMGWAIASAWTKRRFLRLGAIYITAVILHGAWNGLAILGAFSVPIDQQELLTSDLTTNGVAAVLGLIALFIINLIIYIVLNRLLRPKQQGVEIIPN